jgi:hypothetical protein
VSVAFRSVSYGDQADAFVSVANARSSTVTTTTEGREVAMPMSLASVGLAAKQASQAEATVEDLERQLAERKAEAEQAKAEAERAAREEAARRKDAARQTGALVAELERGLPAVLEQAATMAADAGTPQHQTRIMARSLLLGTLRGGEATGGPHSLVLERDPAASLLFGANERTARVLGEATASLGLDHAHVAKLDAIECRLWSAFLTRLRELAGER